MNRQKIIIIILLVVIALLVAYIFWGQSVLSGFNTSADASAPAAQVSAQQSQESEGLSQKPGGSTAQGIVPNPSAETVLADQTEDLFVNPEAYAGKNIQIEGTVYNEPDNNQGLLSFNIKTEDMHYAFVNFLDMDQKFELAKNDHVSISGVITNGVQSGDLNGLPILMPMINASSLKVDK